MYAGAALTIISLIVALPDLGPKRPHGGAGNDIVGTLLGVGIYILIAQASKAGKGWARITGTVLFAINTVFAPFELAAHATPTGTYEKTLTVIIWLVDLSIVILLWERSSSAFFRPHRPSGPPNGTPLWHALRTLDRKHAQLAREAQPPARRAQIL
jgi:hypothetical protein